MYRPRKSFGQDISVALVWVLPALGLAAATFFVAYDNGGYSISERQTLATVIWWTLSIGLLFGLLPRAALPPSAWATGLLLTLFGVFTTASAFWAESAEKAFEEGDRVWLLAGFYFLVVFLAPLGSALFWVRGLALGVTAVGTLALVSRLWPHLFSETARDSGALSLGGQAAQLPGRLLERARDPHCAWRAAAPCTRGGRTASHRPWAGARPRPCARRGRLPHLVARRVPRARPGGIAFSRARRPLPLGLRGDRSWALRAQPGSLPSFTRDPSS